MHLFISFNAGNKGIASQKIWGPTKSRKRTPPPLSPPEPGSIVIWGAFATLPPPPPILLASCEIADNRPNHSFATHVTVDTY